MEKLTGYAIPDYPYSHEGLLLVVGSAPCLFNDVQKAVAACHAKRIGYDVMAINEAAGALEVDHIATMHAENMRLFRMKQAYLRGKDKHFTTHAVDRIESGMKFGDYAAVDHFWNGANSCATSAFAGVKIGFLMGYEKIVLCGCPMNGGDGYYNDGETDPGSVVNPRFGFLDPEKGVVRSWKESAANYAEDFKDHIWSMSGYTREIMGVPEWLLH